MRYAWEQERGDSFHDLLKEKGDFNTCELKDRIFIS